MISDYKIKIFGGLGIIALLLTACQLTDYLASSYTKDEVLELYESNYALFEEAVEVVGTNEEFLVDGPRFEGMHPFIDTPTGREIGYFDGEDKDKICELFELGPYQILCEDDCVSIIFLGADDVDYYTFSYLNEDVSAESFIDNLDSQNVIRLDDCIFFY